MHAANRYVQQHKQKFVAELGELVRFPTVSTDPHYAAALMECAHWLARHLTGIGLQRVRVVPTSGHPVVYGEWTENPSAPTLLIYGHYDVQPADPLEAWEKPPFSPYIKDNYLFGRGASDDKGQLFIHLKAVEALLQTKGHLPVNVKFILDGEEEIGSPNLAPFLKQHQKALAADVALLSDTRMKDADTPAIIYGLRGAIHADITVTREGSDLHSGNFGGMVPNPLQALSHILDRLHDTQGRIQIPGFYDQVRNVSGAERSYLRENGPSDEALLREAALSTPWGETGFSLYERLTIRPSLTITGMGGGYQGTGSKGVIPTTAGAKLNFRLVPHQCPDEIAHQFEGYIKRITPKGCTAQVNVGMKAKPVLLPIRNRYVKAAFLAGQQVFPNRPVWQLSGGTIPVVKLLEETFRMPVVVMGFALATDRLHAPNERFYLPNFFRGINTSIHLLHGLAGAKKGVPYVNY